VPQANLDRVLKKAEQRLLKERDVKERINAGEISMDFYNLRPVLDAEGVVYYEV
jgi:4-hydroxy-4-methyl-2-oxoglutarate aldolase